jgi:hypothetical protein
VASAPGGIGLPQLEHAIIVKADDFSVILAPSIASVCVIARLTYILYVLVFATLLSWRPAIKKMRVVFGCRSSRPRSQDCDQA